MDSLTVSAQRGDIVFIDDDGQSHTFSIEAAKDLEKDLKAAIKSAKAWKKARS